MKRRRLPRAFLQALLPALLATGVCGCVAAPPPADEAGALQVALGPPPADAALLAVSITPASIADSSPAAWRVVLRLGPGSDERVLLGQIALHPHGQPGRFLLRVPPAALQRARLAQRALVLVLEPVQASGLAIEAAWHASADWLPEPRPGP